MMTPLHSLLFLCLGFHLPFFANAFIVRPQEDSITKQDLSAFQEVLATIGEASVTQGEVNSYLKNQFPNRELATKSRVIAEKAALQHLVHRKIVYAFLVDKGYAPARSTVESHLDTLREQARARGETLADFVRQQNMTMEHFRFEAAWKLGWARYLKIKLSEESIQKYFEKNKKQFDGSKFNVSQILIKHPADRDAQRTEETKKKLKKIRQAILAGEMTWQTAAEKHSDAPSKSKGGNIGWIDANGPMDRDFTAQVLKLNPGQISQPFSSRFGIHLVRCNELKIGKLEFRDNFKDVQRAAMKDRFQAIVEFQLPKLKVRYR